MSDLGKPVSVRLKGGDAEEIRTLSGRPASEILRQLAEAWLIRARADRAGPPPSPLTAEINNVADEERQA